MTTKDRTWKVTGRRGYESRPSVEAKKAERRAKVLESYQQHKTIGAIAEQLHLDRGTVSQDIKFLAAEGKASVSDIQDNVSLARRAKWVKVINTILIDVIPYFKSQGFKPSLRAAYYRLRARGLIENTENDYNNLIAHTKEARLRETDSKGRQLYQALPIDCFADETRKLIDNYSDGKPEEVEKPDDYFDNLIDDLKDGIENYDGKGQSGGHWYNQPEYVEVWIEKFADSPTFEKWLEDKWVNIIVNKGYTSISFLWENIRRLKEKVKEFKGAKHVHVLYFGDFDPSGENMVDKLKEYFRRFGLSPSIIRKVALTKEQVIRYRIPSEPVNVMDNRAASFISKYGEEAAEIDAFIATAPDELKRIVQDSVEDHFNKKIFDDMETKYKPSTPLNELKEIHEDMLRRLEWTFPAGGYWKKEMRERLNETFDNYEEDEEELEGDEDDDSDDSDE